MTLLEAGVRQGRVLTAAGAGGGGGAYDGRSVEQNKKITHPW